MPPHVPAAPEGTPAMPHPTTTEPAMTEPAPDTIAEPAGEVPAFGRPVALALALAAADPSLLATTPRLGVTLALPALALAWWAGPVTVGRPVRHSARWPAMLARHRNTAFAAGAVILTALTAPPVWVLACVAALLLGYLLLVDAVAAGPAGLLQWRSHGVVAAAYGAAALVLAAGSAPLTGVSWGPALAALAVLGAAAVAGLALWSRGGRPTR
ncbi:hypothetical protein CFP65_7494 [Kitasatospora sp. MMS16-BH015]|uniref:hypothetical protein n=1 Tax=Kitasatospora sp. MMS16-BH015 TaxID=2018025 RepID=UPI000CA25D4C|nr:hypothetical protein [Kitasatospora sp. MMS16-BH015]AUG82072.1 hypothetical protein CFP65_7494 [Kitasatospora sp. MMS16-BH015]